MEQRILNNLVSALSGHASSLVDRPTFDGTNALQFIFALENYCSISHVDTKDRLQEMIKCCTTKSVARKIQRECVHDVNGVRTPFTWREVRAWFEITYPVTEDADHLLLIAEQRLEDPASNMLPEENMLTYLTRFDDYVYEIDHTRQLWNTCNGDVDDDKKYPPVSEKEKSTWLLARVNEYHFDTAGKFRPAVDRYDDIVAELKWKDNLRIRKQTKFRVRRPLRSPAETLNSSSISDSSGPPAEDSAARIDFLEKRVSDLQSAINKEKRKHDQTRKKAVKNKPFPANAASADEPPSSGDPSSSSNSEGASSSSSSSSSSRCYLCKSGGHYASDCPNGVCSRCGSTHKLSDCDMKIVDCYCGFCYSLGHRRAVCPYTYIGLMPFHKKRTREEAVTAYRKKMADRNKSTGSKSSGSSSSSSGTSRTNKSKKVDIERLRRTGGCINFARGKGCANSPCPFSHDLDGSPPRGRPSRRRSRSRSRSRARKRKRSRSRPRSSEHHKQSRKSRSRSRGRASDRRQLNHAGVSRSRSGSRSRDRASSRSRDRASSRSRERASSRPRSRREYGPHSSSRSRSRRRSSPGYSPVPPNVVDPDTERFVSLSKEKYQELVASQIHHRQLIAATRNVPSDSLSATDALVNHVSDSSSRGQH